MLKGKTASAAESRSPTAKPFSSDWTHRQCRKAQLCARAGPVARENHALIIAHIRAELPKAGKSCREILEATPRRPKLRGSIPFKLLSLTTRKLDHWQEKRAGTQRTGEQLATTKSKSTKLKARVSNPLKT